MEADATAGALLDVAIVVESEGWAEIAGLEVAIVQAARAAHVQAARAAHVQAARAAHGLEAGAAAPDAGITVALMSDGQVQALNRQFRGLDKPTNILSFQALAQERPLNEAQPLGDLAMAFETIAAEAQTDGITVLDHVRHLTVHGVLHLLGHDHQDDVQADRMEGLETRILTSLGVADPYAR